MQIFLTFFEHLLGFSIFVGKSSNMEKEKVERTVVHVELLADGSHHYFGSLAAIYEKFTREEVGITYGSLRGYGLTAEHPYSNKLCTIRKGVLVTIPKKTKK